jgi:hypothetical protein
MIWGRKKVLNLKQQWTGRHFGEDLSEYGEHIVGGTVSAVLRGHLFWEGKWRERI